MDLLIFALGLYLSWILLRFLLYFSNKGEFGQPGNLPPGPRRLPIIGNLLQVGLVPHRSLAKFASIHGPLMSLKLGSITSVIMSSAPVAQEILQTQDLMFCNRFSRYSVTTFNHHELGLPWMPVSPLWKNLRRICNSNLFAPRTLDSNRHLQSQKLKCLLDRVRKCSQTGTAINIGEAGFVTSLNILGRMIFSMDVGEPTSEATKELKELILNLLREVGKPSLVDFFPILKRLLAPLVLKCEADGHARRLLDKLEKFIQDRMKVRAVSDFVRKNDMLDTLLDLRDDENEGMNTLIIRHLLLDLFIAGNETTSSTLEWAMTELLCNPEKLSKVQEELGQVLGRGNPIEDADITRLPYLQAALKETFRMHPILPLLLPRRAAATVQVAGYTVPEGALILVNVWSIGRDPTLWKDPDKFTPERFLGQDIGFKGHNFELLPFGGGRRICPGYPLAVRMLHLMLGSLLNCFDWKLEDGLSPETMDMGEKSGITLQKAQPLRAVPLPLPVKK